MKIQSIRLGELSFSPKDFKTQVFEREVTKRLQSIMDQNNADSNIIRSGIQAIKKLGKEVSLSATEKFTLQCFKIRAQAIVIIDGDEEEGLKEALENIGPEEMYDVIDLCKSEEDIQNMLASIKVEHQKKKDFKDACDIFKEIDFKSAKKDDFELICSLLREFDFNGELISLLENNSHRNIRVLENKSYKKEQDIVLQLDSESSTPTFYLEGQVLVKLTEIPIDNPKTSGEKHYKGITFGGKKGILTTSGDIVANQVLDPVNLINGTRVILLKDLFGAGHHIYLPDEEKIINLSAVIVGTYYSDKNGLTIDENDEDFDKKIEDPETKKIMRFILDVEKGFFYDFDGEEFGKLKIKTDNFILGRDANTTLH